MESSALRISPYAKTKHNIPSLGRSTRFNQNMKRTVYRYSYSGPMTAEHNSSLGKMNLWCYHVPAIDPPARRSAQINAHAPASNSSESLRSACKVACVVRVPPGSRICHNTWKRPRFDATDSTAQRKEDHHTAVKVTYTCQRTQSLEPLPSSRRLSMTCPKSKSREAS